MENPYMHVPLNLVLKIMWIDKMLTTFPKWMKSLLALLPDILG